ncbi:hypothetical protein SLEP1_g50567 [Rubroshorea leprosula]|uniref:Uncharacterized protein n=1 Tax=Rubroshorea leprosula TaxID=152421 RepID=A0AAV5M0G5_9ROSI|nr:hypothetical protein SLEP1_g50567 [Rubroshorea leprosula]
MSLEGTMSVVGSEVMPLDYGSMDSESSPSPTSSERTVEERREQRVVEEEEDEIPSNILEAGSSVDGCYDPDLEIVSEVRGYASELGNKGSLRGLVGNYNLPHHVLLRPAELNEDEVEEVEKLVREEGDVVDILYLTSPKAIEAAELYGPSSLSEAEMDEFINAVGGLHIPKKPRKKSKTSTMAEKGVVERERLSSTSTRALELQPRLELVMGASEDVSEEVAPLQRKKRRVAEPEARGDEVVEFVPRPSPPKIDPEVWEREEAEVQGPGKGKGPFSQPRSRRAKDEAVSQLARGYCCEACSGDIASWTNALTQEYAESVRDRASLLSSVSSCRRRGKSHRRRRRSGKGRRGRCREERKRKICEKKLEAQDKYIDNMRKGAAELKKNVNLLVHNGMEEHISNFLNSSTFQNILKLYRLPTAIVAFTDCRKKVKAQYPEVDVTTVTFGEQEEGVEVDGESLSADFRPLIKLRWEHDAEGRTIFLPAFNVELVAVEEGEEEEEAQGAEAEDQARW